MLNRLRTPLALAGLLLASSIRIADAQDNPKASTLARPRTWSDSTGAFKLKAVLVDVTGETVTLRKGVARSQRRQLVTHGAADPLFDVDREGGRERLIDHRIRPLVDPFQEHPAARDARAHRRIVPNRATLRVKCGVPW